MNNEAIHTYRQRANNFRAGEKKRSVQLSRTSVLRLLLFAGFAWFVYRAFSNRFAGLDILVALVLLALFLSMVFVADSIRKKMKFLQQLVKINENEIAVANGDPSFLSNGAELAPPKGFPADLNVFGKNSLFHILNRTGSQSGKEQLGRRLAFPFSDAKDIRNYQACVKEMAGYIDFRQALLAHTLLFKEENTLAQLQTGIDANRFSELNNRFWSVMAVVWPLLSVTAIVYSASVNNYKSVLAATILGLGVIGLILKKINLLYYHISKRSYLYSQYAKCFRLINAQKFEHPYLQEKQEAIRHASGAFSKLSGLTGVFDLRLSLFSIFINGLFLWDLSCARAYLKWNEQYQPHIKNWFETLGEIELLNSIAAFYYNHPLFVFPQVVEDRIVIEATALGHPLMKEESAVANDVSIGGQAKLHLITGSNMSGKSTFLRTIGLNLVLAQLGAPVFAKHFTFHPLRLLTSFHHIDSLEESTSYFYAELKSLKEIIDALENPKPALVLLDEVMRGTNSKDKHDGSALLIRKLLGFSCLSLIATHDTELGVLADHHPGMIENFCFESELANNELSFDFKMRKGVAQSKNATFLMQKMGIV
ncbi:hypothetical protein GWC95_16075 [Sediminibacterium roseum]|uniref:DNA mismatch repair proteins mutS family domain-containing protein n=1 Tax=Sediminibacterium roseum TaxID=1978412 RepID=A0ABX0A0H7_9BACT|nr:hypothetical protein [Sediminibacterium roseum]NCI51447.1 hypothetical protein [Sediminibacterium roseum]